MRLGDFVQFVGSSGAHVEISREAAGRPAAVRIRVGEDSLYTARIVLTLEEAAALARDLGEVANLP